MNGEIVWTLKNGTKTQMSKRIREIRNQTGKCKKFGSEKCRQLDTSVSSVFEKLVRFLHEYHQNIQRELWNFVKRHNDRSSKSAKPYFSPLCFFVEHHMNDLNLSKNNFHVEKKISTLFSKAMTSLVGSALRISIDKIHAILVL